MVDIGEQFKTKVPKAKIDGKVGRQLYQAESLVKINIDITINHQTKSYLS